MLMLVASLIDHHEQNSEVGQRFTCGFRPLNDAHLICRPQTIPTTPHLMAPNLTAKIGGMGNEMGEVELDFEGDLHYGRSRPMPRSKALTTKLNKGKSKSSDQDDHMDSHDDRGEQSDEVMAEVDNESFEEAKNLYDEAYKEPAWVKAQWGGQTHKPQARTLQEPTMVTGDANATALLASFTALPRSGRPRFRVTSSAKNDIADLDLEALIQKVVPTFSKLKQSYFARHGKLPEIPEEASQAKLARRNGLDRSRPPISSIYEIFDDMAATAIELHLCEHIPSRKLRIFTMCSGTEAPLLAMQLMQRSLKRMGQDSIPFEHLGSAEITPFKQAFIQRNYDPPVLFRDVTEFTDNCHPRTAYGGTAPQPKNIDILIAGTVCKDYSSLNQHPKKFGQAGNSYDTLTGLTGYARRHRPKIIILENVEEAPWWDFRQHLGKIGYEGVAIKVDTKNFYLPQTRQRGYLVAFDTRSFPSSKFDIKKALDKWKDFMWSFQQRATSPFPDFLVPDDDPYLYQVKAGFLSSGIPKDQPWDACRHRYVKARVEKQYGMLRPMTRWQTNGTCVFPDFGWAAWARKQRERIWDTLEIEYLSKAGDRDYDQHYKCRWIELSQNVDFKSDNLEWGMVGCVTPEGKPYLTTRGGPAVGKELLSLQGIPIDDLDLNRETVNQLQDLAGNAMSTPVVAAAIFSAIMAAQDGHRSSSSFFENEYEKSEELSDVASTTTARYNPNSDQVVSLEPDKLWKSIPALLSHTQTVDIDVKSGDAKLTVQQMAGKTMQLCECETVPGMKVGTFKMCRSCGHTACSICCGNPQHEYEDISFHIVKERLSRAEFEKKVSEALPTALQLCHTQTLVASLDPKIQLACEKAHADPVTLRQIKRGRSWKIIYENFGAVLELHFVRKCNPVATFIDDFFGAEAIDCYWLLFLKADSVSAGPHPKLREETRKLGATDDLRELLSRPIARMDPGSSFLDGVWKRPQKKTIQIAVQPQDDVAWISSWKTKLGLQHDRFRGVEVPLRQVVTVLSSSEGAAESTASILPGEYRLLPKCGGASGSLHVSDDHPPKARPVFFHLDPEQMKNANHDTYVFAESHHRRGYKETRLIHAELRPKWKPVSRQAQVDSHKDTQVEATLHVWENQLGVRLETYKPQDPLRMLAPSDPQYLNGDLKCTNQFSAMVLHVPLFKGELKESRHCQYPIPVCGKEATLQQFGWVVKRAVLQLPSINQWQEMRSIKSLTSACLHCVPKAPTIKFTSCEKKCPIANEEVKEATAYENTLRARPQPLSAILHCQEEFAILDLKLDLAALLHRLTGDIISSASETGGEVHTSWRLCFDEGREDRPIFKLKELQDTKTETSLSPDKAVFKRVLWTRQQQALAWMVRQELEPVVWQERKLEDVCVPGLGLRLDMKAGICKTVRGGFLADEVGAGKTSTAFALIAQMLDHDRHPTQDTNTISLKATLILVPCSLIEQWKNESLDCYGNHKTIKVMVIKNTRELMGKQLCELQEQNVVIAPSNMFDETEYWDKLATYCGASTAPAAATRAFQQWLCNALKDSREQVKVSERSCPLLHLFRFQRLIVDEYSYLQGLSFLAILELDAVSKWMLSGTPPLASFDAINIAARLVGTLLSRKDEGAGCFSYVADGRKLNDVQTDGETFQSLQERHSPAWYRARNQWADSFVQTFFRKNPATRDKYTPPVMYLELNLLSAMEQVTYFKVYQRLTSQNVVFSPNKIPEGFRDMEGPERLEACILMSRGPEDALISCCTELRKHMEALKDVVKEKEKKARDTIRELANALHGMLRDDVTSTYEEDLADQNTHFLSYKLRVYNKDFGDESTAAVVDVLMSHVHPAQQKPQAPEPPAANSSATAKEPAAKKRRVTKSTTAGTKKVTDAEKKLQAAKKKAQAAEKKAQAAEEKARNAEEKKVKIAELKTRTTKMKKGATNLNTLTTRLAEEIRQLRFFKNVAKALDGSPEFQCMNPGCKNGSIRPEDANVIGACGHIACDACLKDESRARNNPDGCVAPGCGVTVLPHHLMKASHYSPSATSADDPGEKGSKISAIVGKIRHIERQPQLLDGKESKDKILIFVQLPRIKDALLEILRGEGIDFTDATKRVIRPQSCTSKAKPPNPVEEFKKGNGTTVCVLMLDSPDAAGW